MYFLSYPLSSKAQKGKVFQFSGQQEMEHLHLLIVQALLNCSISGMLRMLRRQHFSRAAMHG